MQDTSNSIMRGSVSPEEPEGPQEQQTPVSADAETMIVIADEEEERSQQNMIDSQQQQQQQQNVSPTKNTKDIDELRGEKQSDKFQLQEDIFSLLFVSPVRSQPFLYAIFWFSFQGGVIALIAYDMLKDSDEDNWLKVPSAVHPAVSAAQVLALAVAVISQDDVISTLALVSVGYDGSRAGIPAAASRPKWILSNVCRFLIGLASLFISFLFVVQSEDVLDLFKDFAAMAFVSEIDDAAFALAKRGFLSDKLEEATRGLEGITFSEKEDTVGLSAAGFNKALHTVPGSRLVPSMPKQSICCTMKVKARLRRVLLLSLFGLMVAAWGYVYSKQKDGDFICQSLTVRFGDQYWGPLQYSYFSGTYELGFDDNGSKESIYLRPVYYERGPVSNRLSGKFFYCLEEQAWVFGIAGIAKSESDEGCQWLLRSPETESFDLSDVPSSGWSIWTGNIEDAQSFQFGCNVCNSDADCNYHGTCNGNDCICEPGRRGESCQLESFCEVVQLYSKDEPLLDFNLLRDDKAEPILIYDRPVYWDRDDAGVSAFIYMGRRWFYIVGWELPDLVRELDAPFFHAYWQTVLEAGNLEAYSEPTEASMPTGIKYYVVSTSRSMGDFGPFGFSREILDAKVHCKSVDCDASDRVCGLFGLCDDTNNTCICEEGWSSGHFCEYLADGSTFKGLET